jgi:hypothetical protein
LEEFFMALQSMIDRNIPRAINRIDKGVRRTAGTLDSIKSVAYDGLHLGVGLVALATENLGSFVRETVKYGEKVEKREMRRLEEFRSDAVKRVRGMFRFGKSAFERAEYFVEDTAEDVIDKLPKLSVHASLHTGQKAKTKKVSVTSGSKTKKSRTAGLTVSARTTRSSTGKKANRTTSRKTTKRTAAVSRARK